MKKTHKNWWFALIVFIMLAVIAVCSFLGAEAISISIIGGADGPTSIFLAGKLGTGFKTAVTIGAVLLAAVVVTIVVMVFKRKGRKK